MFCVRVSSCARRFATARRPGMGLLLETSTMARMTAARRLAHIAYKCGFRLYTRDLFEIPYVLSSEQTVFNAELGR